jgi:hypothetical protein
MARYKPGPGWRAWTHAPVWQHTSGIRIHSLGCILLPDQGWMVADYGDNCEAFLRWMRIAGGNRTRALMMMARDEWRKRSEVNDGESSAN